MDNYYKDCLIKAGAKVIDFKEFGSWQGEWIASIDDNGYVKFIFGYYGSCSGCDSFLSEFGSIGHDHSDNYICDIDELDIENCHICKDLHKRMIEFGKNYVEDAMTYNDAIKKASENLEWDLEAGEMIDFINKYKEYIL